MMAKQLTDPDRFELVCDWCLHAGPSADSRDGARLRAFDAGWSLACGVFGADLCGTCSSSAVNR